MMYICIYMTHIHTYVHIHRYMFIYIHDETADQQIFWAIRIYQSNFANK